MLAITGGKGGCGKSTTALGVATALARRGHRTLVVDADRDMPDLHVLAGVDNRVTVAAVAEGRPVGDVARPVPGRHRVGVLPTAPGVSRAALRQVLRGVRDGPGPVVVDCPAGTGPDAVAPVRTADAVVAAVSPTTAGVRDAVKTVEVARRLRTPLVGCAVVGAASVPDPVRTHFDVPTVAVPEVEHPRAGALGPPEGRAIGPVGRAYDDLVGSLAGEGTI